MRGKFPKIFDDEKYGVEAKKLYDDANQMIQKIINHDWVILKSLVELNGLTSEDIDNVYSMVQTFIERESNSLCPGSKTHTALTGNGFAHAAPSCLFTKVT